MSSKLNIYYQNARGLRTKTTAFYRHVLTQSYDIIMVTETWLLESIRVSQLFDRRYIVWRCDRNYSLTGLRLGGGVLIATKEEFSRNEMLFVDEINALDLKQFNGIRNSFNKTLDLVLASDYVVVRDCSDDPLVPVDLHHDVLLIESFIADCPKFIFEKGNYDLINKELSEINWHTELSNPSIDVNIEPFYCICSSIINKHIPKRIINGRNHYPKWYTKALVKLILEKYKFLKKFRKYGNMADKCSYIVLRDRAKDVEINCYAKYTNLVEKSIKSY